MADVILERHSHSRRDIHRGVFEDHRPFGRVVDAFAGVGCVVVAPSAGDGLGEVDLDAGRGIERAVGAIAGDEELGKSRREAGEQREGGGEEVFRFHGMLVLRWVVQDADFEGDGLDAGRRWTVVEYAGLVGNCLNGWRWPEIEDARFLGKRIYTRRRRAKVEDAGFLGKRLDGETIEAVIEDADFRGNGEGVVIRRSSRCCKTR